jgi:hypothetical protein
VIDTTTLGRAWGNACTHAEFDQEKEARLYYLPGEPSDTQAAIHLHPGSEAVYEDRFPFSPSQLADANRAEHHSLSRIAIRDTPDEPTALALLRHELEHATQYRWSSLVYMLIGVAHDGLSKAANDAKLPTLYGSGMIYNALPDEVDANRAASACVREHFPEPGAIESRDCGQLFRETEAAAVETLGKRLTAFCAVFPEAAEASSKPALPDLLTAIEPALGVWWSGSRPGLGLERYWQAALELAPSHGAVENASVPGGAWIPTRDQLAEGAAAALHSMDATDV